MSSDADATGPTQATEPQARVLLAGSLHPLVLLLRLLDGIRQSVFPLVLGIASEPMFLAVAAVVFLLHVGQGLLRYLTFHYTLTTDELRTREGLLHRQERRPRQRLDARVFSESAPGLLWLEPNRSILLGQEQPPRSTQHGANLFYLVSVARSDEHRRHGPH